MNLLKGALRPRDRGAPHAPPFTEWNAELRRSGPGKPVLLLDVDTLSANLDAVRAAVAPGLAVRVVAKSLPSIPLLRRVMDRLQTRRLMVFDESIALLAAEFPDADFLMGKPLPVQAAAAFYADPQLQGTDAGVSAGSRVAWLIDGAERLAQYAALARERNIQVRVNIEIDVGLHRGGVPDPRDLPPLLRAISEDPAHLAFAGLMGYDAHVTSAPKLFSSVPAALEAAVARYAAFKEEVRKYNPAWIDHGAIYNGGGSKTYMLHRAGGPVNEVALGSCLVKPTDFDVPTLSAHAPALFIATPVLKRLSGTRVPFLEWASSAWAAWDPNREVTYFVFGGGWMAKPVSPAGLGHNPIYGFSTNQAMVNGSERTALSPDDWIFWRPTQSERVMQEFGAIRLVDRGLGLAPSPPEKWGVIGFSA